MDRPCNATELRMFIGCVNYYRDMWPSCAHILKSLTDQSVLKKRAPIKWTDEMQKAFVKMRLIMAADALAAYPDHSKRFNVYTDASDFQLGAYIIQEGRLAAYFLQKLTKSQQNYTTKEKKVLSIVATLEEFQSMLLSHTFVNCSNRMNTACSTSETSRQYVTLKLYDNINDIICYKKDPTQPNWKIALPNQW
jgi:hypothetical protein